ncbi:hypothetical protein HanHA300_Chr14g0527021 [Helianthus annuus]|nr:hypothetical protein HanHA300_Chr14g0527021 [Helianthus annuus]KAJ0485998.1 hypothetical protein HanHA89_Chr14g0574751 [Helianthus annuus]KAJ0656553.1 hypothetical protein HanLR1_Chr14g0537161 [Helianthus annuus]
MTQKQISDLEEELKKRDASIERFTKQIRDLENELEKTKQSESQMLESLMFQTQQIEQTKMDLEESKQDVIALQEKLDNLQAGGRNGFDRRGDMDSSSNTKALRDEIAMLRKEVRIAQEAEERSKKAMDDLASALSEVAMESSSASEKLRLSEEQAAHLKKEIERLHEELELQTETAERIRVESEEHVLAWTAKEMGFISCIKKADEDIASLKHDNHRLNEALVAAENTTRIAREEAFKLRDHVKQALNESSVAKEAATIAQAENTELKDLLAEKEESVHFLTKENERLRINEVAARENVKEFKRLLAAKAEANKFYEEHTDVFNSPDSMLYEDHLDGRNTPRQMFHFDFSEFKAFNKIGELIVGKNEAKKEGSTEQGKEQAKEQGKEQAKEDGKEHAKEQGKEQAKEHGKEQGKEHAKEKEKEKGKEPGKEKGKEQAKEQGKEDVKEQAKEHGKEEGKGQVN